MVSPNVVSQSKYGPVIINALDQVIGKSIVKTGSWSDKDIILIKTLLEFRLTGKNAVVFYDVGANIGIHSLALATIFGEKLKGRAFEAQPAIFNMLCGTLALNNINHVKPYLNAVSDNDGESLKIAVPDYLKENNFGGFELIPPKVSDNENMKKSGDVEIIKTIRLDSFNEPVDFIKMDIEGMEHIAIRGALNILKIHRPFMLIEIIKTDTETLFESIRRCNYKIYLKEDNVICVPAESPLTISGLKELK